MTGTGTNRPSRFFLPTAGALLIFVTLYSVYNNSWAVENRTLHFLLAEAAGFLYGAFILTAPLILYPLLRRQGVGTVGRIAGSLSVLIAWYGKEVIRMMAVYSFAESVFYLLMPMQFGVLLLSMIFISTSELFWGRFRERNGNPDGKRRTAWPLLLFAISSVLLVVMLRRGGESYFFWFYDLYKSIFF